MAVSGNPQLNIRLEIDLMNKVKDEAETQGMRPQEWVRRLIKEALGEVSANVVLAVDSATGISRDEIQSMISESIELALANQSKPKDIEPVAVNVPDAPLNTDDGMMKTVIPSFMLDDHQVDPKHLKSRLEDIKGASLKPLTWQSQYLKECLDEWKQYELWKHFQLSWDMFCEIELGKPSEWIDLFIEGAQDIDPNEIRQSMMDILQSINNSEYTEPVAVDNSMVNPVSAVTAAVTPETPETIAPIEVEPETTNEPEPEPVKVEPVNNPFKVGSTYTKKELREAFQPYQPIKHNKQAKVQDNHLKTWLIQGSKKTLENALAAMVGYPSMWQTDDPEKFPTVTYIGGTPPTPPVESSPTVEAVEAEPEKK